MKIEIVIYTETNNPFCGMAKQWLDINNYEYDEQVQNGPHEIQGLYESLEIMFNTKVDSLPQILVNGEYVGGFDKLLRTELV
jgi:glutaredoxin|tara:strand:+ start:412 stop:657 length:246 start_codon:yes stop_codon:yes gene_type:complete